MMVNYLNAEIKKSIESDVAEMLMYLDFVECVEQINRRYAFYDQIGYGVVFLIKQTQKVQLND